MHSDGAALAALSEDGRDALDRRVETACAAPHAGQALHALARELRDEGLEQRVLYDLFESHRARRTEDDDEAAFDGLCDAMDFICGWHSPDDPMRLFPEALPQAQSRTREWQGVQAEAASNAVPDTSSRCQAYAMVAGFISAVACVHCSIAVVVTATATKDYTRVALVVLFWVIVITSALSIARTGMLGRTTPVKTL